MNQINNNQVGKFDIQKKKELSLGANDAVEGSNAQQQGGSTSDDVVQMKKEKDQVSISESAQGAKDKEADALDAVVGKKKDAEAFEEMAPVEGVVSSSHSPSAGEVAGATIGGSMGAIAGPLGVAVGARLGAEAADAVEALGHVL